MDAPPGDGSVQPLGDGLVSFGFGADGAQLVALNPDGAGWRSASLRQLYTGSEVPLGSLAAAATRHGITAAVPVGELVDVPESLDTPATMAIPTTTTVMDVGAMRWELLHSADGIAWSRQSVAELAGVEDEEINIVTRVQAAGDTVVVAVTLRAPEGEPGRQIVLVGTPAG
jgi:hypothetical protein